MKIKIIGNPSPYWLKARCVHGLKLSNIQLQFTGKVKSVLIYENGKDLELDNVNMKGVACKGPVIKLNQVKGVFIHNSQMPAVETFLYAEGDETEDISFIGNDLRKVKIPFDAAEEVRKGTVFPTAEKVKYGKLNVSKKIKANERFKVNITLTNTGSAGAFKAEVYVDEKVVSSKWLWLEKGETREVTLTTCKYYESVNHRIKVGRLTRSAAVRPAPAAFEFGSIMKINSPAAAGKLTTITVPLKNIGGQKGTKEVKLYADGKAVTSEKIILGPGEEKNVTIKHRFKTDGSHKLKIADFPVWPFATFANTEANFYQTREKIIIEAGGGLHDIRRQDREYAAVYLKDIKGDFVADVKVLRQEVTGPYSGGGLMAKNDMTKPKDSSGCVIGWSFPKYNAAAFEQPMEFNITKRGNTFVGDKNGLWLHGNKLLMHSPIKKGEAEKVSSADAVQDVGIFANAYSAKNELCRVEFQYFKIENMKGKKV
jgi:hypothetical protein